MSTIELPDSGEILEDELATLGDLANEVSSDICDNEGEVDRAKLERLADMCDHIGGCLREALEGK